MKEYRFTMVIRAEDGIDPESRLEWDLKHSSLDWWTEGDVVVSDHEHRWGRDGWCLECGQGVDDRVM